MVTALIQLSCVGLNAARLFADSIILSVETIFLFCCGGNCALSFKISWMGGATTGDLFLTGLGCIFFAGKTYSFFEEKKLQPVHNTRQNIIKIPFFISLNIEKLSNLNFWKY
jgi:hypothetical protein